MLVKRAKTRGLFLAKLRRLKEFFYFKIAKFEFRVSVHYYGLWGKTLKWDDLTYNTVNCQRFQGFVRGLV